MSRTSTALSESPAVEIARYLPSPENAMARIAAVIWNGPATGRVPAGAQIAMLWSSATASLEPPACREIAIAALGIGKVTTAFPVSTSQSRAPDNPAAVRTYLPSRLQRTSYRRSRCVIAEQISQRDRLYDVRWS